MILKKLLILVLLLIAVFAGGATLKNGVNQKVREIECANVKLLYTVHEYEKENHINYDTIFHSIIIYSEDYNKYINIDSGVSYNINGGNKRRKK